VVFVGLSHKPAQRDNIRVHIVVNGSENADNHCGRGKAHIARKKPDSVFV
jgi:hypothetical protein